MSTDLLTLFWVVSAAFSIALWSLTAWGFRALPRESLLHQIVAMLTILSLVLFDVLIALGFLRAIGENVFRPLLTFAVGVQFVAALSAAILVRSLGRRGRRR